MDFSFSSEQDTLRDMAARFFAANCDSRAVRRMMDLPGGHDPALWKKMAQNGWMAAALPEAQGGFGSFLDLAVILEEAGRWLLPGPYLSTMGFAVPVLLAASEDQRAAHLPAIAEGRRIATLAVTEASGRWDANGIALAARQDGASWVLDGTKCFVPDAACADLILVVARSDGTGEDGISIFALPASTPGVTLSPRKTLDRTRGWSDVRLEGVRLGPGSLIGPVGGSWPVLTKALDWAAAALAAESTGGIRWVLDTSVDYAKTRKQFDHAIGSYQAVSHRLATLMLEYESARSASWYASWAVDEHAPDRQVAVAMAKAWTSDAYRKAAWCGIQTHGGIGFTWEHDMHLHFRRAKASEVMMGDAAFHRERVAGLIGLRGAVGGVGRGIRGSAGLQRTDRIGETI